MNLARQWFSARFGSSETCKYAFASCGKFIQAGRHKAPRACQNLVDPGRACVRRTRRESCYTRAPQYYVTIWRLLRPTRLNGSGDAQDEEEDVGEFNRSVFKSILSFGKSSWT